jgi:NAD(P)-dependent dehydrogenase (short-subunit alcohol dehydrogenase family)
MEARVAVVTGGNRGIGFAIAEQLLAEGFEVVLVCRDPARGAEASAALESHGRVRLIVGNLGTLDGGRATAAALAAEPGRIDVLVHNAGIWPSRRVLDADGLEAAFVTNHLAPFVLNHVLAPRLAPGARVVQVSAGIAVTGRVDVQRIATGADFHPIRTYANTKLANLLLIPRFAEVLGARGVTVNAVHPGVIRTGLGDRGGPLGLLLRLVKRRWDTPANGARPVVRLATDPALSTGTGRYFVLTEEQPWPEAAGDPTVAAAVWEQAVRLTGVGSFQDGQAAAR